MPSNDAALARLDVTFRANLRSGRHGWLRLTPAYSLHLVETLVDELGPVERVLDPFSGTATTPLVCAERGVVAESIDVNPFLVWFGNLKLQRYEPADVSRFCDFARGVLERACAPDCRPAWLPQLSEIEKWWDDAHLTALSRLIAVLERPVADERLRSLGLVAFCKTAIACAKVSFGHQSMSFRRSSVGLDAARSDADDVHALFVAAVQSVARSILVNNPAVVKNSVLFGDSRDVESVVGERRYGAVVTSPPYPNRMSYVRELRPYMYWLRYLRTGREAGELDWRAIGGTWGRATGSLATWKPREDIRIPVADFDLTVAAIASKNVLLGAYVARYFEDFVLHVRSLRRVLCPGARLRYVVGNSKFFDVVLATEQLYAEIFRAEGFTDTNVRTIRRRTSKRELFEYVVEATRA